MRIENLFFFACLSASAATLEIQPGFWAGDEPLSSPGNWFHEQMVSGKSVVVSHVIVIDAEDRPYAAITNPPPGYVYQMPDGTEAYFNSYNAAGEAVAGGTFPLSGHWVWYVQSNVIEESGGDDLKVLLESIVRPGEREVRTMIMGMASGCLVALGAWQLRALRAAGKGAGIE